MASFSATAAVLFTKYSTYIGVLGLFSILTAICIYMYNAHFVPAAEKRTTGDVSNNPTGPSHGDGDGGPFATVTFFHVDWCDFCTRAQPAWDRFRENMHGKTINGRKLLCADINLTDNTAEGGADLAIKQKYNLKEYPTIQLDKGGKITVFDAAITDKSLHEFVNKMV